MQEQRRAPGSRELLPYHPTVVLYGSDGTAPLAMLRNALPYLPRLARSMSRIGRNPIKLPESVQLTIEAVPPASLKPSKTPSLHRLKHMLKRRPCREGVQAFGAPSRVVVTGPLGELSVRVHSILRLEHEEGSLRVTPRDGGVSKLGRTMWGTTRSYIANAVRGVSQGFRKELELHGVGLRAQVVDRAPGRSELVMKLGYCHDSVFAVPPHLSVSTPTPTTVVVFGTDRQQVGLAAARIRDLRRPDAYKGKGVRYAAEVLRLKKGKKK